MLQNATQLSLKKAWLKHFVNNKPRSKKQKAEAQDIFVCFFRKILKTRFWKNHGCKGEISFCEKQSQKTFENVITLRTWSRSHKTKKTKTSIFTSKKLVFLKMMTLSQKQTIVLWHSRNVKISCPKEVLLLITYFILKFIFLNSQFKVIYYFTF